MFGRDNLKKAFGVDGYKYIFVSHFIMQTSKNLK